MTEPAGRPSIAPVESITTIAEDAAIASNASRTASTGLGSPRIPVTNQNPAIGMLGSAITEQPNILIHNTFSAHGLR